MSIRSITPCSSCSEPIGISVATTCWPKACLSDSRLRKKSARSRSSMFTKMVRARPSSSARSQRRLVVTSTPITPFTTKTALSQTRSAASASATKLGSPGVSIRLILRSSQRNDDRLAEIDISRAFSSAAESETVFPSATEPSRLVAPASNSSASFTDVFPLPRWPTKATLRILFGDSCAIRPPSQVTEKPRAKRPVFLDLVDLDRRLLIQSGVERLVHRRGDPDLGEVEQPLLALGHRFPLKPRSQPQNGLGVKLRHARLRDPQDLADLPQGEVLVVVEGHHQLLAFRHPSDRLGQAVLHLGRVDLRRR